MDFIKSVLAVRIDAMAVAAILVASLSLTVQAAPPTSNVDDATTVVAAHPDSATLTQSVSYGDLNLASPKGVATLMARVKGAVNKVCSPADNMDLRQVDATRKCRESALAGAMSQINSISAEARVAVR